MDLSHRLQMAKFRRFQGYAKEDIKEILHLIRDLPAENETSQVDLVLPSMGITLGEFSLFCQILFRPGKKRN